MPAKRKQEEESAPKVPAYIVTFSDMVTLLLTFFVMLLSLANTQNEAKFHQGQKFFLQSINNLGLGFLRGTSGYIEMNSVSEKFRTSEPNEASRDRIIDAKKEQLKRLLRKIENNMEILPSQIKCSHMDIALTNVRFSGVSAELTSEGKKLLTEFLSDLQNAMAADSVKLCVIGFAGEPSVTKEQWLLSARRAEAVGRFLRQMVGDEGNIEVYCWGAGSGGAWVAEGSLISDESQVVVGILRAF